MAISVIKGYHTLTVICDTSSVWDSTIDYPDGLTLESIEVIYNTTGRAVNVLEKHTGAVYVGFNQSIDFGSKLKYFNLGDNRQKFYPLIQCTAASAGVYVNFTVK